MFKKILVGVVVLFSLPLSASPKDYELHLAGSYGMAVAGAYICDAIGYQDPREKFWCSALGSLAVGFAKEVYDHQQPNNHFDVQDLVFDIGGAVAGASSMTIIDAWSVGLYVGGGVKEVGLKVSYKN